MVRVPEPLAVNTTFSCPYTGTIRPLVVLILNGPSYRDPLALRDQQTMVKQWFLTDYSGPFQELRLPWPRDPLKLSV